ncbi:MAG: hypothetical protein KDK99_06280, partial [Verrucomicrobiales bacterium]|nr:hypothetical protein [Verrucomicrobiales bacterium]
MVRLLWIASRRLTALTPSGQPLAGYLAPLGSADSCAGVPEQASPGNGTLLRCTIAAFTSTGIPAAFGVLCHLDAP